MFNLSRQSYITQEHFYRLFFDKTYLWGHCTTSGINFLVNQRDITTNMPGKLQMCSTNIFLWNTYLPVCF